MKSLWFTTFACLILMACTCAAYGKGADELHIRVRLTTGERSRDSSSQTTTITVERDAILSVETFSGRRRGTPAVRKEFKLSPEAKEVLVQLIRASNLLVTGSIELPRNSSNYRYFEISVDLTLGEKTGMINISGMRTALEVKEEKLYQNALTLVKALYRIMSAQDKSVLFEELIHKPKG